MSAATSAAESNDEGLVALARAGDRDAWFELDRRLRNRLVGLARSILGNEDLAHEAAQIALMRAYEHLDQFDPGRPLVTWVLTIGGNCARDIRRAARVRPSELGDGVLANVADAAPDGPGVAVHAEELAALRECVAGLKERSRIVVTLYMTGFSLAEIGRVFHRPKSTIQTWLERVKDQLRRCLGEKGVAEP